MKTTVELPEDLMRRVQTRARTHHQKIDEAVADILRSGMGSEKRPKEFKLAAPVRIGTRPLTTEEVEDAINWGRD